MIEATKVLVHAAKAGLMPLLFTFTHRLTPELLQTMMPEQSVVKSPPARSYALQAIQASSSPGQPFWPLLLLHNTANHRRDLRCVKCVANARA